MARCRICPAPRSDTAAVLLLRVWPENDELRGRLLSAQDAGTPAQTFAVAQGATEIGAAVQRWLHQL